MPALTVLAGANSSGKSSLLQSLLFLAQSDDEGIVLNGTLARLGDAADVIRDGQDHVAIGAVVESRLDQAGSRSQVAFRIELKNDAGALAVRAMSVYVDDEPVLEATARGMKASQLPEVSSSDNLAFLRVSELYGRRAPAKTYVGFSGLGPEAFIYRNTVSTTPDALTRALRSRRVAERARAIELLSRAMARAGEQVAPSIRDDEFLFEVNAGATARAISEMSEDDLQTLVGGLDLSKPITEWVPLQVARFGFSGSAAMRGVYQTNQPGSEKYSLALRSLSVISEALRSLRTSVRYLGPLRAEPRVVSPTGGNHRSLPVGARGEYTADLLTHERGRPTRFVAPDGSVRHDALPVAVSMWSNYLGIGDRVTVLDQGKLGRGLRVVVNGIERDLTTIGVGASQVLPVLALVLGSRRGSLILLEQPELHLHPAVQSRLADFLMFARPDVHVMVETHSEYLVTRIRLRVAKGEADRSRVDVLFADHQQGVTAMRSLELDQFGDFGEWPPGFFDAQDADSRDLVAAINNRLRG